jgi:hypothetical protein
MPLAESGTVKSFVVRLLDDGAGLVPGETLRGVVDEVGTGRRDTFSSNAELVGLLAAALRRTAHERDVVSGEGRKERDQW